MRILLGVALGLLIVVGVAVAIERPNSLDLRVDGLTTSALTTEPATQLVDPARQAAATRRAHWTVTGFMLTQIFEALALFYLWSSGGAAVLRDALRRRFSGEWTVRFLFGAALALVARLAAFLPAFYLYRVDRTLDLTFELTRYWALFWIFHTFVAMLVAGTISAIVLWLAARTHQWYAYLHRRHSRGERRLVVRDASAVPYRAGGYAGGAALRGGLCSRTRRAQRSRSRSR